MTSPSRPDSVSAAPVGPETLFGHPRGLSVLFMTEMWERFSYYGMRALLVLYMVKYLLLPGTVEHVVGYATVKSILEWMFGPLDVQPIASQIYGFYTFFVYLTPILGGIVADRFLGKKRTILIGGVLMAIGQFLLAFDSLFFFGLLFLVVGNGAFKPNLASQVGGLYAPGDHRRDSAYSIYYVGINVGAALAPIIAGTIGEEWNWHYGYAASGIGMLVGIFVYARGSRHLPVDLIVQKDKVAVAKRKLDKQEWQAVLALFGLMILNAFFWATYEQSGNTIALWADDNTDRVLNFFGYAWEFPTTWVQSMNPLIIFLGTPPLIWLWARQAARGTEPSTIMKMAIGLGLTGLSYLVLMAAALLAGGEKSNVLWLVLYFIILTTGELYLSPIGQSLVSKVAPARIVSLMMGVWFLANAFGNWLQGFLGSYWSRMDKANFFLMIASIAFAAAAAILLFNKPLRPFLIEQKGEKPAAAE
jgi:POT family proton-dependent oligopeptide transporter